MITFPKDYTEVDYSEMIVVFDDHYILSNCFPGRKLFSPDGRKIFSHEPLEINLYMREKLLNNLLYFLGSIWYSGLKVGVSDFA